MKIRKRLCKPRFIPTLDLVDRWSLFEYPTSLSACPSLEINDQISFEILYQTSVMKNIPMGYPWMDSGKNPIVLVDTSFFSRFNLNYNEEYPIVNVRFKGQYTCAVAKPLLLTMLSPRIKGVISIRLKTQLYGYVTFDNVLCRKINTVQDNTLLIPGHLWDLFRFNRTIDILRK